jgi:aspartokinase-like uncharacterized kinase
MHPLPPWHVVKLGGSLLDLPDLPVRFRDWLDRQPPARWCMVVGGGRAADTVRRFDRWHGLGEERGHWLAVRAMQFNTRLVAAALGDWPVVADPSRDDDRPFTLLDPHAWLARLEAAEPGASVPHRWSFTSDSIAAHAAAWLGAGQLTLLKSTLPDGVSDVPSAAGQGLVDADFPEASTPIAIVTMVNLRAGPHAMRQLRGHRPAP